jgi:hypothetical protein
MISNWEKKLVKRAGELFAAKQQGAGRGCAEGDRRSAPEDMPASALCPPLMPLWTGQRFSLSRGPKIRSRRIETGYIHLDLHPRSRQTLYNCFYIGKLTIDLGTTSGVCYKVNKLRVCARIACPM